MKWDTLQLLDCILECGGAITNFFNYVHLLTYCYNFFTSYKLQINKYLNDEEFLALIPLL